MISLNSSRAICRSSHDKVREARLTWFGLVQRRDDGAEGGKEENHRGSLLML